MPHGRPECPLAVAPSPLQWRCWQHINSCSWNPYLGISQLPRISLKPFCGWGGWGVVVWEWATRCSCTPFPITLCVDLMMEARLNSAPSLVLPCLVVLEGYKEGCSIPWRCSWAAPPAPVVPLCPCYPGVFWTEATGWFTGELWQMHKYLLGTELR